MEEEKETVNDRIRIIMTREGHNVNTFAKKVGVPWTTVKNLISKRNLPSYEIIVKIIESFDWVDANYLIMGELYDKNKNDSEKLYSVISGMQRTVDSQLKTIERLQDYIEELAREKNQKENVV